MASEKLGAAVNAASAAGYAASGNYVLAAVSAARAIAGLFGGGGSYAVGTGYNVRGNVDQSGFHGTLFGLSANGGDSYVDPLADQGGHAADINRRLAPMLPFLGTSQISVDTRSPLDIVAAYNSVVNAVANALQSRAPETESPIKTAEKMNMDAAVIPNTGGSQGVMYQGGGGSGGTAGTAAAKAAAALPSWLLPVAVAAVVLYLVEKN